MPTDFPTNGDDYNNIVLRGDPAYDERLSPSVAPLITPGDLVEVLATGRVQAHGTAADTQVNLAFALEDSLQGKTIRDDYAISTFVRYAVFKSGDQVLAILDDDVPVAGALLESAGDGRLQAETTGQVVGQLVFKYTDTNSVVRAVIQIF